MISFSFHRDYRKKSHSWFRLRTKANKNGAKSSTGRNNSFLTFMLKLKILFPLHIETWEAQRIVASFFVNEKRVECCSSFTQERKLHSFFPFFLLLPRLASFSSSIVFSLCFFTILSLFFPRTRWRKLKGVTFVWFLRLFNMQCRLHQTSVIFVRIKMRKKRRRTLEGDKHYFSLYIFSIFHESMMNTRSKSDTKNMLNSENILKFVIIVLDEWVKVNINLIFNFFVTRACFLWWNVGWCSKFWKKES